MRKITRHAAIIGFIILALTSLALPTSARTGMNTIQSGDAIFTGEEGLDLSCINATATHLVHYSDVTGTSIDNRIDFSAAPGTFDLLSEDIHGITGPYYLTGADNAMPILDEFVYIQVSSVTLDVLINGTTGSAAGRSVNDSLSLDFIITHNLMSGNWSTPPAVSIEVSAPGGGMLTALNCIDLTDIPLSSARVCIRGIPLAGMEEGTYAAQARWPSTNTQGFNNKGYDSNIVTFGVTNRALGINSDRGSVIRGNNFTVTITGESNSRYFVYIRASGSTDEAAYPWIPAGQSGVTVGANPPKTVGNATAASQADVTTTGACIRSLNFSTNFSTKNQIYTIEVIDTIDPGLSGYIQVRVERGEVTISGAGFGYYYIGEEITLSGTNTANTTTWLYLVGQNLGNGNGVKLDNARVHADNYTLPANERMLAVPVDAARTWHYTWDTRNIGLLLNSGGYTIYAAASPNAGNTLGDASYATATLTLRSPLYVTLSSDRAAQGDSMVISGMAFDRPDRVYTWIFGRNCRLMSECTFDNEYFWNCTLDAADTQALEPGQYYIVVQDTGVDRIQSPGRVVETYSIIRADGSIVDLNSLQACEAAYALVDAITYQETDDLYAMLTFKIEEPWIRFNQIPDRTVNSTFTLSGTTSLAAGRELFVSVTPVSLQPESSLYTAVSGTAIVVGGSIHNKWSFSVNASGCTPGEYEVWVEVPGTMTNQTSTFSMLPDSKKPPGPGEGLVLVPGWNFISTPKRLSAGNNTAAIFQHVDTCGHSIFAYDAGSGAWRTMAATDEVRPLDGIWIYANDTALVWFDYDSGAVQTPPVKSLSLGWNAIGFSALEPASARDTLYTVRTGWANLIGWSAEAQQYETAIVNSGSSAFSDTRLMRPGQGYWLYMTERGDLSAIGV